MSVRKVKCASCGTESEEPYGTGMPVCHKCGSSDVYRIDENAGRNIGRGFKSGHGLGRGTERGFDKGSGMGRGGR